MPIVMAGEDAEIVMVQPWQSWWEEIKSGKRTFSFKGKKVEYRFKPDGTWETLAMANPPDDGPKPTPAKPESTRPEKNPPPTPDKPPAAPNTRTGILVSAILLGLGLFWYVIRRHLK